MMRNKAPDYATNLFVAALLVVGLPGLTFLLVLLVIARVLGGG